MHKLVRFFKLIPTYWYAIFLSLAYIATASIRLALPGPQYDELAFTNIALGSKFDAFADIKIGNVPTMILPYISALKSYLYYPIFELFGVSAVTIRLPGILLTGLGVYLLYLGLAYATTKKFAFLPIALLVFDPTFIALTRLDVGYNLIEIFCKLCSLYLFFALLNKKQPRYLYALLFILGIGVLQKLNFIWYVNSFGFASLIVYWRELRQLAVKWLPLWKVRIALVAGFGFYYGLFLFLTKGLAKTGLNSSVSLHTIVDNIPIFRRFFWSTINGQASINYLLGSSASKISTLYSIFVAAIVLTGAVLAFVHRYKTSLAITASVYRIYLFSYIILITTVLQILVTSEANAPWHYFAIYPFTSIILATSIYFIYLYLRKYMGKLTAYTVSSVVIITILSYQTLTYAGAVLAFGNRLNNWYWSDAVYSLIEYTRAYNGRVVSVDWGTHTQLISFDYKEGKYLEAWGKLYTPQFTRAQEKDFAKQYLNDKNTIFVKFNPERAPQQQHIKLDPYAVTNASFFKVINDLEYHTVTVQNITDKHGMVIYEIYKIEPNKL